MKVINLIGGPGVGKSTLAAEIFSEAKKKNINIELVTEYAKMLIYEKRYNVLEDQLYIFAKQNRKLRRLAEYGVKFAISDSPLILSVFYEIVHKGVGNDNFISLGLDIFNTYENYNFFLERDTNKEFQNSGRLEFDISDAVKVDNMLLDFLSKYNISYQNVNHINIKEFLPF